MDAYLDIETTGLSPLVCSITVIGIYRQTCEGYRLIQLVGDDITDIGLAEALEGVSTLYTYNGARFDLGFIEAKLGYCLPSTVAHRDLMKTCWGHGLYGGLKAVERRLGIGRELTGVSGRDAIDLWWDYVNERDTRSLETLLQYNKEDVVNLKTLRECLEARERRGESS